VVGQLQPCPVTSEAEGAVGPIDDHERDAMTYFGTLIA
jgi:hypothetical protein